MIEHITMFYAKRLIYNVQHNRTLKIQQNVANLVPTYLEHISGTGKRQRVNNFVLSPRRLNI